MFMRQPMRNVHRWWRCVIGCRQSVHLLPRTVDSGTICWAGGGLVIIMYKKGWKVLMFNWFQIGGGLMPVPAVWVGVQPRVHRAGGETEVKLALMLFLAIYRATTGSWWSSLWRSIRVGMVDINLSGSAHALGIAIFWRQIWTRTRWVAHTQVMPVWRRKNFHFLWS